MVSRCIISRSNITVLYVVPVEILRRCRLYVPDIYQPVPGAESENRECVNAGIVRHIPDSVRSGMCDCVPVVKEGGDTESDGDEECAVPDTDIAGVVGDGDAGVITEAMPKIAYVSTDPMMSNFTTFSTVVGWACIIVGVGGLTYLWLKGVFTCDEH